MICPVCRFGNFPGDDTCANCGADLWNADTPQGITTFRGNLLGLHLDALGAPEPHLIEAGAKVRVVSVHGNEIKVRKVGE